MVCPSVKFSPPVTLVPPFSFFFFGTCAHYQSFSLWSRLKLECLTTMIPKILVALVLICVDNQVLSGLNLNVMLHFCLSGRNEIKKPNVPKPSGSLLPRPDDISTCSLLDSILQRNVPLATPRAPRCQRCNELGHAIQSCPKDPTRLALKPSSERNGKEGLLKRPKFMDKKEPDNPMLRMDPSNGLKIDPVKTCSLLPVVFDQLKSAIIPEVDLIWQYVLFSLYLYLSH